MEAGPEPICVRAQKHIHQLAIPENAVSARRFAPRDSLYNYLASEYPSPVIAFQILECLCSSCSKHRRSIGHSRTTKEKLKAIIGFDGTTTPPKKEPPYDKSALALFSLFVAIGYPALITVLLNRNYNDGLLQSSHDDILGTLTSPEKWEWMAGGVSFELGFRTLLQSFLPMFAVPHFDNNHYREFGAATILPFINEDRLGQGGYSNVYKFTIYPCYNELGESGEFVRKELSNDAPLQRLAQEFDDEANNLQTVTGLQSDYIVKLIKTYKHGDRFNIIFRKEKSDLDHFLRDESWQDQAELLRKGPLESCAIWQHALGITVALGQISCIPDPMASSNPDTREKVLNGFHFDLKPANILVSDLSWLITDFGIARFQQADDGATSRVLSMGGTDSYAPPEMLRVTEKFSRRYDVWSLGCILLEVTAYAVGGRKALLELDAARRSGGRHLGDNRFYSQTFHPGIPYQVKPAITTFMSSLKHREKASGEISGGFLQAVLELITKMLQPLVEHRIEIQKVVPELKRIVASHSQQIPGTPRRLYAEPDPNLNEIDTTPDALRSMKVFHLTYDASGRGSRQLFSARLHTFRRTNGKGTLRVVIADPNQHERPMSLQLNERTGRIIPFGMFETNDRVSFEDSENGSYHDSTFEFLNPADADSFQSHMTHQDISGRYRLSDVEVERRSEFSVSRFFRNRDASDFDEPLGAATAQLWVESEEAFVEAGTWLRSRSQEHTIPIRRLVLFCGQVGNKKNPPKIVSIVVTGAIRYILEHDRPRDLDPRKTRFVPNKPSSDRYISVATIQPLMVDDETRDLPSIPLSITSLRKEEEKVKFDCKKVDLTFSDEAARKDFEKSFNSFHYKRHRAKERAEEEQKGIRKHQSRGSSGLTPTYGQPHLPSSSGSSRHSKEKGKERADFDTHPAISTLEVPETRGFGHRRWK